jgi:hypothetical protein
MEKTKTVKRLSFYFVGGTAQDFNLDEEAGDTLNPQTWGWTIKRADGTIESVFIAHVAWMRMMTITRKVKE